MMTQLNRNTGQAIAKRLGTALLVSLTMLVSLAAFAQKVGQPAVQVLKFSNSPFIQIKIEVARTDAERAQGLMNRKKMDKDTGMLFISAAAEDTCMWMKNTLLPLSVAFIDADGRIVNIEDMQPKTLATHCATAPVRYALEMNLGWFAARQITPGTKVLNLPR